MSTLNTAPSVGLPYHPESSPPLELKDIEELHERHSRDIRWGRTSLLLLIFGMLSLNLWMTNSIYNALTIDIDASRMAMAEIEAQSAIRLEQLDKRLATIERGLAAEPAGALAVAH
ncbi:MAG: hypothetical protein FJ090_14110 [Deltaproteobacteria bacterium]|nr:hypothetical protein [Deltaproteobacteria bacterium]